MDELEDMLSYIEALMEQKKLQIKDSISKDGIYYYNLGLYEGYKFVKEEIQKKADFKKNKL